MYIVCFWDVNWVIEELSFGFFGREEVEVVVVNGCVSLVVVYGYFGFGMINECNVDCSLV